MTNLFTPKHQFTSRMASTTLPSVEEQYHSRKNDMIYISRGPNSPVLKKKEKKDPTN